MEGRSTEHTQKMSYEELENVAAQLSQQNQQLYHKLQQADMANILSRLNFLFKVVENRSAFRKEFIEACVNEIENIMTISESEETKEE